jgi:DNA-directed RNA polymerase subunit RPC12/RpoP
MSINHIYKISCKDQSITDIYIGSTNDIRVRERQHKSNCHNERNHHYNLRVYQCIRANGGWANWIVTILEEFQCHTKMEKTQKERPFIEQFKPTLNKDMPANHQTNDQWDKAIYHNAYQKERMKKYIHCPYCNHVINFAHKSRHYKSNRHINNIAIQNNINKMYQEMKQIYDANVLVLERINTTMLQIQEMVYVRKCS